MANELQPLSLLFQNRLFRIPDYQRGYAWLQQQLVDFWDDLVNLQADRYHYTGLLSLKPLKSKETVSWGEDLWLVENGYKPCHIVDLKVLILLLKSKNESIGLTVSASDISGRWLLRSSVGGIFLRTAELKSLKQLSALSLLHFAFPTFLAYILSFIYVGIYWANHHHLINMTDSVSGRLLWKNLHWIFWMSLIPMATEWMGLNPYKSLPALFYGIILFMCAVSYNIVQAEVIKINGKDSQIFRNIGNDLKGKLSIIAYAAAIIFAFYFPVISYLIYIAIALTWIVPDSRLEKA